MLINANVRRISQNESICKQIRAPQKKKLKKISKHNQQKTKNDRNLVKNTKPVKPNNNDTKLEVRQKVIHISPGKTVRAQTKLNAKEWELINKKESKPTIKGQDSLQPASIRSTPSSERSSLTLNAPEKSRSSIKRILRKQLWELSKSSIKGSNHWNSLLAKNNIDIDNINIDKIDLSLINVDALGIQNKLLKRTVTWLLK
ncbi:hypothetical protein K1T71_010229 [Dendrolimus kikuchii]|uniref:Uncharacterized protein n=1 Tax=Dendrolimus kikuchii TaxID=765133 RepID=A0ACC1CR04_9NEOP|nr:hypothetical protein K1T71_010229 [Dendrolimus kikuchii]